MPADVEDAATAADIARWEAECGVVDPWPPIELTEHLTAQLEELAPGPELAWLLSRGDLATADDEALVEVVAAWQRVGSWVTANTARAAAVLSERDSMNPVWPARAGRISCTDTTAEELAMRLGCSRRQARLLVRDGRAFDSHLAPTGEALARGHIDPVKARHLVDALVDLPFELALDVQEAALPHADRRTPNQLSKDIERAVITMDPAGAQARHETACTGRRVNAPRRLPHGMAGLWAVLPASGAVELDTTLDTLARTARTAGDPRTLDQLRADLLVDLTTGMRSTATAGMADDDGAVVGRSRVAAAPGAADDVAGNGMAPPHVPQRARIHVTVALTTLAGLDDHPADLAGYGPITSETARILARGGTWQRILTDPVTGTVLDVGRTRYRPPADLAEHVRARDRACARPGCSTPADSCDLDHTGEYHELGTTSHDNLGPLCRRDHTIKTHGGFQLSQPEPGVFRWTTPTGRRYTVVPGRDAPYDRERRPETDAPPF